jgi:hypothetical protein
LFALLRRQNANPDWQIGAHLRTLALCPVVLTSGAQNARHALFATIQKVVTMSANRLHISLHLALFSLG